MPPRPSAQRASPRRPPLPILAFAERGTGPRLEVHRLDGSHPALGMAAHGHGFFEMLFIERGAGTHRVGDLDAEVRPGALFVVAPGEAHDARAMRGVRGWLILFAEDAVGRGSRAILPDELLLLAFLRPAGASLGSLSIPSRERAEVSAELARLQRELEERALGWQDAARARLTLVLVRAARLAAPLLGDVGAAHRPLVGDVLRFIEARYTRPITPVDVARAVKRSPAYLTDLVRRETGKTVGQWLLERRMAEARRRLVETAEPMTAIAEAVGYEDESYFARRFRKVHGLSPAAFRARRR